MKSCTITSCCRPRIQRTAARASRLKPGLNCTIAARTPVDLTGWELDGGVGYRFYPGQTIAAGRRIWSWPMTRLRCARFIRRSTSWGISADACRTAANASCCAIRSATRRTKCITSTAGAGRNMPMAAVPASNCAIPTRTTPRPEAWAASDETGKSSWQTYTYRMRGQHSGRQRPADDLERFHSWACSSAGECLIDDISVDRIADQQPHSVYRQRQLRERPDRLARARHPRPQPGRSWIRTIRATMCCTSSPPVRRSTCTITSKRP